MLLLRDDFAQAGWPGKRGMSNEANEGRTLDAAADAGPAVKAAPSSAEPGTKWLLCGRSKTSGDRCR